MLTDMTLGQYYPGHSYLHQMDPRAKILCTMIFIVAIFLANNLYSYIVVAGFTFLAITLSGVPAKMIWKAIKPLWVILVFTMLISEKVLVRQTDLAIGEPFSLSPGYIFRNTAALLLCK